MKKFCLVCEKVLNKASHQSAAGYLAQKYCSNKCKGIALYGPNDPIEKAKWVLSKAVKTESGCLEYRSAVDSGGYGRISAKGSKQYRASRFIYSNLIGEIPERLLICHKCDNTLYIYKPRTPVSRYPCRQCARLYK